MSQGQNWAHFVQPCLEAQGKEGEDIQPNLCPGCSLAGSGPGLSRVTTWQDHSLMALCAPQARTCIPCFPGEDMGLAVHFTVDQITAELSGTPVPLGGWGTSL